MKKEINKMLLAGIILAAAGLITYVVAGLLHSVAPMIVGVALIVIGAVIAILHLDEFKGVLDRIKRINNHTILLLITVVLFIVLYGVGYISYGVINVKGFEKLQTFLDIFRENAALICIACGMTCVMLTGGIDISVGSVVAMDCMILAVGMEYNGMSPTVLVPMVLIIGIVFGAVIGYLVGYLGIQPFIATMAGMFFARGMTAMICTDQVNITVQNWFKEMAAVKIYMPFELGVVVNKRGVKMVPYVGWPVIIALIVVVLVFLMLRYTRLGRSMYAVGGSQTSAALMGLNVKRTKMITYILSSFLCSIGGILYCMNTMCGTTTQALGLEMKAISSAVIGGTLLTGGVGNVIGSFFGVLINGTITTLVSYNADLSRLGGTVPNVVSAFLLFLFIMLQTIFAKLRERKK